MLARDSRGRRHILVTNVNQVLIVASAAEPTLKPNLIDRFLVTAHQAGLRPLITINKVDLIDLANLMPFVGVYSQLGYSVLLVSAQTDWESIACAANWPARRALSRVKAAWGNRRY